MFESSGSQFFRTTTEIQSGPEAFDKSRFVMIFLTTLGATEILCSFRLVLEGKIVIRLVENTISNSSRVQIAIFLGSDRLSCLSSICKFLQWLLTYLNITLGSEDLFCWYKQKKWILWNGAAAQAAENHGDEWSLTIYLQWEIYSSISPWAHSQNWLAVAKALTLKRHRRLSTILETSKMVNEVMFSDM